ncbi:hypothetical protein MTO96_046614 [Rhipicephalus appendiculatus]
MLPSASSPLDSGTVLFRPANAGASFTAPPCLVIAQALSALPRVKEVRVNTKKNIVAADASTTDGSIALWPRRSSREYPRLPALRLIARKAAVWCRASTLGRPGLVHFSVFGADAMDTLLQLAGDQSDALRCGGHHGKDASCTSKIKCLHCGRPHSAYSRRVPAVEKRAAPGHHQGVRSHLPA